LLKLLISVKTILKKWPYWSELRHEVAMIKILAIML